jgi:hypothetical protein
MSTFETVAVLGSLAIVLVLATILATVLAVNRRLEKAFNWKKPETEQLDLDWLAGRPLDIVGQLMFKGPRWRNRSVRRIRFLSTTSLKNRYSLDFTIPDFDALQDPSLGGSRARSSELLVPLLMVPKGKLSNFSLEDESGNAVPVLNSDQERSLVVALLLGVWDQLFPGRELGDDRIWQTLFNVVRLPAPQARIEFLVFVSLLPEMPEQEKKFIEFLVLAAPFIKEAQLFAVLQDANVKPRRILKLEFVTELKARPARDAMVSLIGRAVGDPLFRRIENRIRAGASEGLKNRIAIVDAATQKLLSFPTGRYDSEPSSFSGALADIGALVRGALSRCGVTSREFSIVLSPVGARSVHLEIEAPDGTYFTGGRLVGSGHEGAELLDWVPRGSQRAHLSCGYTQGNEADRRQAIVRIRARRRGWLLAASVTAAVMNGLLGFVYANRDVLASSEANSLIAVALGVGTIAVVYLFRPNEHLMTTRLLEGPRFALVFVAFAGITAVCMLSLESNGISNKHLKYNFRNYGIFVLAAAGIGFAILLSNYLGSVAGRAITAFRREKARLRR